MVKKYGELYLNARKALRPSQGDNASVYARELLSLASGKSVAALLADRELYASEEIEEKPIFLANGAFTGCRFL